MILVHKDYKVELTEKDSLRSNLSIYWKEESGEYNSHPDINLYRGHSTLSRIIGGNFRKPSWNSKKLGIYQRFSSYTCPGNIPRNLTFYIMSDLPYDESHGFSHNVIDDEELEDILESLENKRLSPWNTELFLKLNNLRKEIYDLGSRFLTHGSDYKIKLNQINERYSKGVKITNTLLTSNLNLIPHMGKLMNADIDDVFSDMVITLRNSILRFNPNQNNNTFSTYACMALKKTIIRVNMKKSRFGLELLLNDDQIASPQNDFNFYDSYKVIEESKKVLSDKEKDIIENRYLAGKTLLLKELAVKYGVSGEAIRSAQEKALIKMRKHLLSRGISE